MAAKENSISSRPSRPLRSSLRRLLGHARRHHMNTISLLDNAWRDVKYGARLLRLNPAFAFVAILSLALGIGANTAIFQLLDAVRIRTLPVENPQQLVDVRVDASGRGRTGRFSGQAPMFTYPLFEQ